MLRVIPIHIALEARGALILPSLDLYRDDLRVVLQDEVDLAAGIRVITGLHIELPPQLLQDIVFRELALELVKKIYSG